MKKFICKHSILFYPVMAFFILINIIAFIISPLLGFINIVILRNAMKIK